MPLEGSQSIPLSLRRSVSNVGEAGSLRSSTRPGRTPWGNRVASPGLSGAGSVAGSRSVSRYTSASTGASAPAPRPRIRSGTHGFVVGITTWTGVPSPAPRPCSAARLASNRTVMKIGLRSA